MNSQKVSPLQKVPFIQRICFFAAKRHVDPLYLSQVSNAFAETLQAPEYGTASQIYHNLHRYDLEIARRRHEAAIQRAEKQQQQQQQSNTNNTKSNDDDDQQEEKKKPGFVRTEPLPTEYFLFHLCASPDHKERFWWLIEALINTQDMWLDFENPNNGKMTPLVAACICGNEKMVELLLHNGASPNVGRRGESAVQHGSYPALLAALKGKTRMLKALLDAGANINPLNPEANPVFSSIKSKSSSCLKLLVERGNANLAGLRTIGQQSVIDLCCQLSYFDGILFILKKVNDDDAALEQKLLAAGADAKYNITDFGLPRLLGHKLAYGHIPGAAASLTSTPLLEGLKCGNDKIFKILLRHCKIDFERQNKLAPPDQPKLSLADAYTNVVWGFADHVRCDLVFTPLVQYLSSIPEKSPVALSSSELVDLQNFINEIEVDPFAPVSIPKEVIDAVKRDHLVVTLPTLNNITTFHYLFGSASGKKFEPHPVISQIVAALCQTKSLTGKSRIKALMTEAATSFSRPSTKAPPSSSSHAVASPLLPVKPYSIIEYLVSHALEGGKNEKKKSVGKPTGRVEAEVLIAFNAQLSSEQKLSEVVKANPALKKMADEISKEAASVPDKKTTLPLLKSVVC